MEYLFVYGTLRPPQDGVPLEDCRFYEQVAPYVLAVEPARMARAELYDCGAYPMARPGRGRVYGDLLRVRTEALEITDSIEGHPDFFTRSKELVNTRQGWVYAWVYWGPASLTASHPRIPSGDWFRR